MFNVVKAVIMFVGLLTISSILLTMVLNAFGTTNHIDHSPSIKATTTVSQNL